MRVRARVNQVDIGALRTGLFATVRLDANPGKTYRARLAQLTRVAVTSRFSDRVRVFTAVFTIEGRDPPPPNLSAAVDVELERHD
jgi:hypothetical protein